MTLLTGRAATMELVRVERASPEPVDLRVVLDQPFRLVFDGLSRGPVTIILQKSPTAWGYLGAGHNDPDGTLLVPGRHRERALSMIEASETGIHRFVVISLVSSPTIDLNRYLRDELPLDIIALSAIATAVRDENSTRRAVLYCDILVVRDPA